MSNMFYNKNNMLPSIMTYRRQHVADQCVCPHHNKINTDENQTTDRSLSLAQHIRNLELWNCMPCFIYTPVSFDFNPPKNYS